MTSLVSALTCTMRARMYAALLLAILLHLTPAWQAISQPVVVDTGTEWSIDGTRWAHLARRPLISWQHAPYAGTWDASGLRVGYLPTDEPELGFSLGLHQVLGGRARESQGPMGNSISAFRSSEIMLLARTPNGPPQGDAIDYELLAAWSGIVENDPLTNILTTLRFRGGYRGGVGETDGLTRHQLFAEGLLATNTIALGISDPYYGVEGERGMYGPRTLRLYAGLLGYVQVDPESSSGLEPFAGLDGTWDLVHRSFALLYGAELRRVREIEWSARIGLKLGDWTGEGFFVDVTSRGSQGRSPIAGVGVGYEFSR